MTLRRKTSIDAASSGDPAPPPDFRRVLALAGILVLVGLAGLASILVLGPDVDDGEAVEPIERVASTEKAVPIPSSNAPKGAPPGTTSAPKITGSESSAASRTAEPSTSAEFAALSLNRNVRALAPTAGVGGTASASTAPAVPTAIA